MPSLSHYQCVCGTKYTAMQHKRVRAKAQIYECTCGAPVVLYGGVNGLWVTMHRIGTPREDPDWTAIPPEEVLDWS